MDTFQIEGEEDIILVEFAPVAGVRSVSLSPRDAIEKSREAIEDALDKMRGMAKRQQKLSRKKVSRRHEDFRGTLWRVSTKYQDSLH